MDEISSDFDTKNCKKKTARKPSKCEHQETFVWPTVRTTWAEGKRIRPDTMSFEAKDIDCNLEKLLAVKE